MTRSVDAQAIARAYPGMDALLLAIDLAGSIPRLALAINTTPSRVNTWIHSTRRVPLEYVGAICEVAHDPRITPHTLRPDYVDGFAVLARHLRKRSRPASKVVDEELEGEPT
ncbi:DNA-binding transcriptional regulator YdaS (Cro superfamily) [Paraburkholderia atlantica]|uniref:transcriptional regulator n=1 Tax=Paraburkholderia atlantica TaxID=2654982 RepID=UPI003D1B95D3